jgi:hypothetical protein
MVVVTLWSQDKISFNALASPEIFLQQNWLWRRVDFITSDTFEPSLVKFVEYRVSRGSPVSTVSNYGLDGRGSIPDRGRGFFL